MYEFVTFQRTSASILIAFACVGLQGCDDYRKERAAQEEARGAKALAETQARQALAERQTKEAAEALRVKCVDNIDQLIKLASMAIKNGDPENAKNILLPCRDTMVEKEALATYLKADQAINLKLKKKAAAELQAIKAAKKKEGVRIGMSQQDALDSAWGKPERVNRTTTQYGVREQWVYDNSYLYFENGKLISIQN